MCIASGVANSDGRKQGLRLRAVGIAAERLGAGGSSVGLGQAELERRPMWPAGTFAVVKVAAGGFSNVGAPAFAIPSML